MIINLKVLVAHDKYIERRNICRVVPKNHNEKKNLIEEQIFI